MLRVINVDKNTAFPPAVEGLKEEGRCHGEFGCVSANTSTTWRLPDSELVFYV